MDWMTGWKTWVGGLLLIGTGLATVLVSAGGMLFHFVSPENPAALEPEAGMIAVAAGLASIGQGFGMLGLGHKLEKLTVATRETAEAVEKK